jgi:hypothetical protein
MDFRLSSHAEWEMTRRGIPLALVRAKMNRPEQRLVDGSQQGRWIYQSRFPFDDERIYLVRVVVDEGEQPGGGRKPRTGPARSTNIGASNEGGIRSRGGRPHCPASSTTSAGKGMTRRPRGCWAQPTLIQCQSKLLANGREQAHNANYEHFLSRPA